MLPLLDADDPPAAFSGARALGIAFQLTNFLRDIGEDLDRGRVYFPSDELDRFGVDPYQRRVNDAWRAFCRFQIERIRSIYREADDGIGYLSGRSAAGIRTARRLYAEILDRIEVDDYDVFSRRARVPLPRKLTVAAGELLRSGA
jgi:phytoene synthase